MKEMTHVAHVVCNLSPGSGGPSAMIAGLCHAVSGLPGIRMTVLAQKKPGADEVQCALPPDGHRSAVSRSRLRLALGLPLRAALESLIDHDRPAVIHNHGLWTGVNYWAARQALRQGIPLAIQTHGMLAPWAMAHKGMKKRLALAAFQRHALHEAHALIATSEMEYRDIRELGFRNPVALIPNGVDLGNAAARNAESLLPERERVALFLGRIAPVKGLATLMRAWAAVRPPGWRLRIVGPDSAGHLAELQHLARELGIVESVTFADAVYGEGKAGLFRASDMFVLPSLTENFGVVVAEALMHGVPVLTTRGTPWFDLVQYHCGWWTAHDVEAIAQALRAATALTDAERAAMGERGSRYVQRYDWRHIAADVASLYSWMAGSTPAPACVRMD
jgi:glycosyltransferase involved in cell wall biosynthesis